MLTSSAHCLETVCPSIVVKFFGADSDRAKEYSPEEEEVSLSKGGKAVEFLSNLRSGAGGEK
jgi:hypothetical protein